MTDTRQRSGSILIANSRSLSVQSLHERWSEFKDFFRKEDLPSTRSETATSGVDEKPVEEMLSAPWNQM